MSSFLPFFLFPFLPPFPFLRRGVDGLEAGFAMLDSHAHFLTGKMSFSILSF
jgi:hypothetical protein